MVGKRTLGIDDHLVLNVCTNLTHCLSADPASTREDLVEAQRLAQDTLQSGRRPTSGRVDAAA